MAKFLSQVYTSIRGKVGGIVYTKNQFAGLVARAFTSPTNPKTGGQELIRTSFAEASGAWEGATQAKRDAWDTYAATLDYQGPHGSYKLPGRQVYMSNLSLAKFLDNVGGSSISVDDSAPLIAGFENVGAVIAATYSTVSSTGVAVSITNPNAYGLVARVQRSIAYNPTKNTFDGPFPFEYTQAEDVAASSSTIIQIETGIGTVDQAIFLNVRLITEAGPHRITNDYQVRCIAVTNGP
jgi:hypothetical protein